MAESLINANDAQLALDMGPVEESNTLEKEAHGDYTGARLFAKNPGVYTAIVKHLADGIGLLKIADLLSVSVHTVIAVRDREGMPVAIERARLAATTRAGARLAAEGILEDLGSDIRRHQVSAKDKAIILGVLTEKSELLSGGATSRIQLTYAKPGHDDFNAFLDAELVEPIHLEAGTPGQKGEPGSDPGLAGGQEPARDEAGTDQVRRLGPGLAEGKEGPGEPALPSEPGSLVPGPAGQKGRADAPPQKESDCKPLNTNTNQGE